MSVTHQAIVFSTLLCVCWCGDLCFPPGFRFGVGTSAYQVEGAWNVGGKGQSVWDSYTHKNPQNISDGSNGDVACDSYHNWRRDVQMVTELGLDSYRFSISWSRLLPTGFANNISEDGKNYYSNLIDELLRHRIEPMVTLYHWDLPIGFYELGGWTNPSITEWYLDYVRVVFDLYGDRVKIWFTINEPIIMCEYFYNNRFLAPDFPDPQIPAHMCAKNTLIAHAKAWRLYDKEYKPKYNGKVSIVNVLTWIEPPAGGDEELAALTRQYYAGLYSHPIYSKQGGWPSSIEKVIEDYSIKKKGYCTSTLPVLTEEEINLIKGTYDFYAMNHYSSRLVRKAKTGEQATTWSLKCFPELNAILEVDPSWPVGSSEEFASYPEGIRKQAAWVKEQYGDVEILITENGYTSEGSELNDNKRIEFMWDYLQQIQLAIKIDGVNITGYTYWSLMDNFEWLKGYTSNYGLYEVDFSDLLRPRIPRKSARFYAEVIRRRSLDIDID